MEIESKCTASTCSSRTARELVLLIVICIEMTIICHTMQCKLMDVVTRDYDVRMSTYMGRFQCSAIDYTRHTLDGAASLLNSNKYFPSRVTIKESSIAKIGSVCRRVYRIFSHAFYHHRQIFDQFEVRLFNFFLAISQLFPSTNIDTQYVWPSAAVNVF